MAASRYRRPKSDRLLDNGEVAAAQIELDRALSLGQPLPDLVPLQARALLAAGKPQAVIAQFGSLALADAQPTAALRTAVAQAQATLGDWPAARDNLAQALRAVPGHEAAMLLSARLASVSRGCPTASWVWPRPRLRGRPGRGQP